MFSSNTPVSLSSIKANNGLGELSKTLKFEDDSEMKSQRKKGLEVVAEDEELFSNTQLAHISEIERSVSHESSLYFSASNDSNKEVSMFKSLAITAEQKDENLVDNRENDKDVGILMEVGSRAGSANSIKVNKKEILDVKERLFDNEKYPDQIENIEPMSIEVFYHTNK